VVDFLRRPVQLDHDESQPLAPTFAGFAWDKCGFQDEVCWSAIGKDAIGAITLATPTQGPSTPVLHRIGQAMIAGCLRSFK